MLLMDTNFTLFFGVEA